MICGSDQSSVMHLESYRSYLISRMSRDDMISQLKVVHAPEIYSDPPEFDLKEYEIRPNEDLPRKMEEKLEIWKKHKDMYMRRKTVLDEYLEEAELDEKRTVCFTTNSKVVYSLYKQVEHLMDWHFTKAQNVTMFHLQL